MRYIDIAAAEGTLRASRIILGTTHFGTRVPEKEAYAIMDKFAELGGNTIDTARVYGDWSNTGNAASEAVVGKWLRENKQHSDFVLITKGAHPRIGNPVIPRVKPVCIREDIELSLKNIGRTIDLFLLHRDDPSVPVSEIMPALHEYVKAGSIRAIGCSNWSAERKDEANRFATEHSLTPFTASEIQWSLAHINREMLTRLFGSDVFGISAGEYKKYRHSDTPLLSFTSIAWGFFTRLLEGAPLPQSGLDTPENLRRAEIVRKWNLQTGKSATALAVSYITSHPYINAAACVGCSNKEQVSDFMTAGDLVLPKEFFLEIDDEHHQAD